MEYVTCTLCGADKGDTLFEGSDLWYGIEGRFPVRRCSDCGLIYISPRPKQTEIARYYPSAYAPYQLAKGSRPNLWHRWSQRLGERKKVRAVEANTPAQGTALDIGCATGDFLAALRSRGWVVVGVETNAQAAAYAQEQLGLEVFTGILEDARFPDDSFSLVTMWHVLEHLHDPVGTLDEVARIIRPGGILLVAVPDPYSLEARLFGRFWAGWDVPRHLHIFSRPLLTQLLQTKGWFVKRVTYMTGRHWLFSVSLHHLLHQKVSNSTARRIILATAASTPVRLLMLPLFSLLEKLEKGSIMVVFAERLASEAE